MASFARKLLGSSKASSSASTINSREIITKITTLNNELSKNHLPHIEPKQIYQFGTFDFKTAYSIKEHEQTISLQHEFEEIKLLSSLAVDEYKKKGYKYLHYGLIQIALKPLSRTGIDQPVLMLLRDKTLNDFEDSLLGVVQTNLCNGPIYFNCAPNFQISLHDPTILNTLVLDIHMPELKFHQERHGYLLLYRIYFKQTISEFNPRCLLQDNKGETTILAVHGNDTPTTKYVPKQLTWNEITIPDQWKISNSQPPRNFEQRSIQKITQTSEGKILLKFETDTDPIPPSINSYYSKKSFSEGKNPMQKSYANTSRASFSEYRTGQSSDDSEVESNKIKENLIKFKAPIAEPVQNLYPTSPTQSDFINVITKEFIINKDFLKEEFLSSKNKEKRNWYFKTFKKEQTLEFREIWYKEIQDKEIDIPFFIWFEMFSNKENIDYPFKEINVNTKLAKIWDKKDGKQEISIHPPLEDIIIKTENRNILATPFKTGANQNDKEPVTKLDIKGIYQQNNYQSQILYTIAKQVERIEFKEEEQRNPFARTSKPLIHVGPMDAILPNNDSILENIMSRLESLNINKGVNTIKDNESTQESESDNQEINKIKNIRSGEPYYKRHTPIDLLFEERYSGQVYTGEGIYTWNIDGLSEFEILNTLQEITMAATAYKNKKISDNQACRLIVAGFLGNLKNWWTNSLDNQTREYILNHTEEVIYTDPNTSQHISQKKENGIEVLIHTITLHFIGNPTEELESKKIILTNLRCPTLGDFKWYKDVFTANIFLREDCNQPFWKERFVSGLPSYFAERIINKLKDYAGGQTINWNTITYGQLFGFIKKEGLSICQEHRERKRNDNFKFKQNMGDFCKLYGYERLNPPSREKRNKERPHKKRFKKFKHHQNFQKNIIQKDRNIDDKKYYSKKKFNKKKTSNKQNLICWNCKRPGHRSSECKIKKRINEIFQDQPDMQEKFTKLLISETEESDSSEEESIYSINEIEDSDSSLSDQHECSSGICNCKQINVITNDEKQFVLDVIDKVNDPEIKKEYLLQLKDIISKEKEYSNPEPYNIQQIFKKYPTPSLFKQVTTGELQEEIKYLKTQIKELQQTVNQQAFKQLEIDAKLSLIGINNSDPDTNKTTNAESSSKEEEEYIQIIERICYQKWYTKITLHISYDFKIEVIALMDTGADHNCIREGLIPTKYYEKTTERLSGANGSNLKVQYKLPKAKICNNGICFINQFILVKNLSQEIILGTPFFTQLYPFKVNEKGVTTKIMNSELTFEFLTPIKQKEILNLQNNTIQKTINLIKNKQEHISHLQEEITYKKITEQLKTLHMQSKIKEIENKLIDQVCSELPNAFWERKQHSVELPYIKDFNEKNIPTKARPIQMNNELLETCKQEINDLIKKKLIRPSKSPWSCAAFYVNKQAEKERGVPRLVINYKPLNDVLQWIRYPIPNKRDLLKRLYEANIFSKFDMKSGFWQIQIIEKDKYKTAFTVPFGHYEWNVMPFGLKNAPSEFQHIMNDIFNNYSKFMIVYIDDILIYSNTIDQHFNHLNTFIHIVKKHGLVLSAKKMSLFQTSIRF